MIGSMMSMMGYWVALFCLVVWMVVRIARNSGGLAVIVFLFWPASLFALLRYWGDRDSDIRVPFVLAVLTAGLTMHMAGRVVDQAVIEAAPYFSDADIEEIRREDPKLADAIERARADARAAWQAEYGDEGDEDDLAYVSAPHGDRAPPARAPLADRAPVPNAGEVRYTDADPGRVLDPVERERERQIELRRAVDGLSYRFGTIGVGAAELAVPREFRFLPRAGTMRLARLRGYRLADDSLGWVVHRDVDLAADDAWFADVRWLPNAVDVPQSTLHAGRFADGAYAPRRVQDAVATWSVRSDESAPRIDAHAARATADGVLLFSVPGLLADDAELGLRATRLLALRSRALREPGKVRAFGAAFEERLAAVNTATGAR